MTPVLLTNWRLVPCDGPGVRLCGIVSGHPRISDGAEIVTSPVVERVGPWLVRTGSGMHYRLAPHAVREKSVTAENTFVNREPS